MSPACVAPAPPHGTVASPTATATPGLAATLGAALDAQRRAHLAHPMPSLAERLADLKTIARFVRENRDALCDAVSADYGHRSRHETVLCEIGPVLAAARHAAAHLRAWMRPQRRRVDRLAFGLARNEVVPQPLGVVGVIVPWNFPINLSLVPLVTIFAAGNRAMVKMSENSRHLARLYAERLPKYFPAEKLAVFDETGGVGVAFSHLPFDHLLFTGSGATGRAVMAAAATNLVPVTLELGGKAPAVVCDDFPLELAAERILFVKYLNAGQICTSVDHVFVPYNQVEAFVDLARRIVAARYPTLDSADYTSIVDRRSHERLKQALSDATAHGARVVPLLDGPAFDDARHRIAPHVVVEPPPQCVLMQREIFGPILPVLGYHELDEVIDRINAGPRPLALYPFSNRRDRVDRIVERAMSGGVTVNDALLHVGQDDLPFGGVGESGMGHYHGLEGFNAFSKLRPIFHQARYSTLKLLMPPYGRVADRLLALLTR
jgi:coniferyl-aldehyde dehydrogenase